MPTPPRTEAQKLSVKARIEDKYRAGYRPAGIPGSGPGAIRVAAEEALAEGEFLSANAFISAAHDLAGTAFEPDDGLYRPQRYQQPVPLAVVHPATTPQAMDPSGRPQRILAIGDLHQDPLRNSDGEPAHTENCSTSRVLDLPITQQMELVGLLAAKLGLSEQQTKALFRSSATILTAGRFTTPPRSGR